VDCSYPTYTGKAEPDVFRVIPPTQLVDCSYPTYTGKAEPDVFRVIPPTQLVGFGGGRSHLYFASYFKTTPLNPTAQPTRLLMNTTFISLAGTGALTSTQLSPASGV
jgi:hypothetical protein